MNAKWSASIQSQLVNRAQWAACSHLGTDFANLRAPALVLEVFLDQGLNLEELQQGALTSRTPWV